MCVCFHKGNARLSPKLWAVIPAGGRGQRFGSSMPKQYMGIAGRPVLDHVLDVFLQMPEFERIVVAIPVDDRRFMELYHAIDDRVVAIVGGAERADSVLAGLQWMAAHAVDPMDWVFVHDAARPLLTDMELFALFEAIEHPDCPGAVLGVPAADTLKRANVMASCPEAADSCVGETIDRSGLWHAMTPQVFRLGALLDALTAARDAHMSVTDEAQAMESLGVAPWLVRGRRSNIKLTYAEDIELIEAVLSRRQETT